MNTESNNEEQIELKRTPLTEGYNSPGRAITKNFSSVSLGSLEKSESKPSKSPQIIKKVGKCINSMLDKIDSKFIEKTDRTSKRDET